jgi:hypothetical protein
VARETPPFATFFSVLSLSLLSDSVERVFSSQTSLFLCVILNTIVFAFTSFYCGYQVSCLLSFLCLAPCCPTIDCGFFSVVLRARAGTMLKSSLKTPSRIDHELFPLLTVRTCVSEADESKNGPRFCAEDKMTGAAYEVRSRKLELLHEPQDEEAHSEPHNDDGTGKPQRSASQPLLSSSNLRIIRRQQARIDALLSAAAHGTAPPSVALPIDVYIQEQPLTGDTYVASVDAFAGLSLGDIIRSGWGVMEEQVFLEILNAVESFGYASASLPPHGNLSADAIKQLLIVRDGASEARQPSRWVVSDWLLLSSEADGEASPPQLTTAAAAPREFDVESFMGDLEWMLHSSFAQLRISTSADGAFLAPAQVEEVINETVERIRAFLMQQAAERKMTTAMEAACTAPDTGCAAAGEGAVSGDVLASVEEAQKVGEGASTGLSPAQGGSSAGTQLAASAAAPSVQTDPSNPSTTSTPTKEFAKSRGAGNGTSPNRSSPRQLRDKDLGSRNNIDSTMRNMSLKDKMAYHQAALRNEQMLVNKQRRKNAPLPPRPTPAVTSARRAAFTPRSADEEEDADYNVPSTGLPIQVKPSAYLMQGRRGSTSGTFKGSIISGSGGGGGGGNTSARKLQSPRSARTPNSGGRTPREGSRSATAASAVATQEGKGSLRCPTTPRKQTPTAAAAAATTPRDQRERLLEDVVNMAVMNQRRRGQCARIQLEADRRRREERQHALLTQSTSPRKMGVAMQQRTMPPVLEQPRVVVAGAVLDTAASFSSTTAAPLATTYEQQRSVVGRRSGTVLNIGTKARGKRASAAGAVATDLLNMDGAGTAALQAVDWPANLSESPEPIPPSPFARRVVHNYTAPAAAPAPNYRTPLGTLRARVAAAIPQGERGRLGKGSGGGGGVRGRAGVVGGAAAGVPLNRLLRPTVGPKLRADVNTAGRGGVQKVQTNPQRKMEGNAAGSARGAPLTSSHAVASQGAKGLAGGSGGHPLSARGKKQLADASSAAATMSREEEVAKPTRQQQQQQEQVSLQDHPTPYVKPLPLSTLGVRRFPSSSASPRAPPAGGSARNPHPQQTSKSPHGGEASPSNPVNQPASSGESTQPPLPASPRPGGTRAVPLQPGSGQGTPRGPNTARPPPLQPALSLRGYQRVASTGVLPSRTAGKASPRSGVRGAASLFHYTASHHSPLSGLRETPGAARVDGVTESPGTGVEAGGPRLVPRKAVDIENDKTLASVNRKPLRRLVPEKAGAAHETASEAAQRSPRAAAGAAEPGMATPRTRPTSSNAATSVRATPGYERPTQSNAARRKAPLTLGNVRPVNETSPGILLRYNRRPTA